MLAILAPMTSGDVFALVFVSLLMAALMYITPDCGHEACAETCKRERVKDRERRITEAHALHTTPYPYCPLCR